MKEIEYFVRCVDDNNLQLWRHRYFKQQLAPLWEKLNPEKDKIEEFCKIVSESISFDVYPIKSGKFMRIGLVIPDLYTKKENQSF